MAGIVALVTVGLWFDEKPAENRITGRRGQPTFTNTILANHSHARDERRAVRCFDQHPSSQASGSENRVESEAIQ